MYFCCSLVTIQGVPICAGCNSPIVDRFILKVLDKPWHSRCLRCSECQKELKDKCYSRCGQVFCKDDFSRSFVVAKMPEGMCSEAELSIKVA